MEPGPPGESGTAVQGHVMVATRHEKGLVLTLLQITSAKMKFARTVVNMRLVAVTQTVVHVRK